MTKVGKLGKLELVTVTAFTYIILRDTKDNMCSLETNFILLTLEISDFIHNLKIFLLFF